MEGLLWACLLYVIVFLINKEIYERTGQSHWLWGLPVLVWVFWGLVLSLGMAVLIYDVML